MSDWQVGDLAVCVDNAVRCRESRAGILVLGRAYKVAVLGSPRGTDIFCLGFRDHAHTARKGFTPAFAAERFRKIRPDKHEACEEEFVTLLKRRKVPAHA
jgi:hypothetical protein